MATVQEEILKPFYAKLGESNEFDHPMIDVVCKLLDSGKKLKGDELVALLAKGKQEGGL